MTEHRQEIEAENPQCAESGHLLFQSVALVARILNLSFCDAAMCQEVLHKNYPEISQWSAMEEEQLSNFSNPHWKCLQSMRKDSQWRYVGWSSLLHSILCLWSLEESLVDTGSAGDHRSEWMATEWWRTEISQCLDPDFWSIGHRKESKCDTQHSR